MKGSTRYVCEYQLLPDCEWSTYGPICSWTGALDYYARHVSQYPTEAVRIREIKMSEEFIHEFLPAGYEEKGQ